MVMARPHYPFLDEAGGDRENRIERLLERRWGGGTVGQL